MFVSPHFDFSEQKLLDPPHIEELKSEIDFSSKLQYLEKKILLVMIGKVTNTKVNQLSDVRKELRTLLKKEMQLNKHLKPLPNYEQTAQLLF